MEAKEQATIRPISPGPSEEKISEHENFPDFYFALVGKKQPGKNFRVVIPIPTNDRPLTSDHFSTDPSSGSYSE